jgi:putative NADH-flavin reductase
MRLAVIGATRGVGLALVQEARRRGHEVTALVRPRPERPGFDPAVRVIDGDGADPEALARTVEGQDAVVTSLGVRPRSRGVTLFSTSTRNLLAAMRAAGVQRLVAITGIGAGDSKGHGGFLYDHVVYPYFLADAYADKDRQEELIRESDREWLIVRPGFLTNGPRSGAYRAITDLGGVRKAGKIARADVAAFVLDQLERPTLFGRSPLLVGRVAREDR